MTIPRNLSNLAPGASGGGVLSASYGGTGLTTLTANNVLLGNGTGALQVVAPGTTGNVLTSNGTTWASSAAPGGGSWIYLSTVTASAAATADIETTFNSTYDNYAIVASAVQNSVSTYLNARFKVAGSYITTGGAYKVGAWSATVGATATSENNSSDAFILTGAVVNPGTSSTDTTNYILYILNPASTTIYKTILYTAQINNAGVSQPGMIIGGGALTTTTGAVTGVRLYFQSGTITGTFRLYGIKNS